MIINRRWRRSVRGNHVVFHSFPSPPTTRFPANVFFIRTTDAARSLARTMPITITPHRHFATDETRPTRPDNTLKETDFFVF